MKKLCLFISSLIFFLGCFVCFGLDSFADEPSYSDRYPLSTSVMASGTFNGTPFYYTLSCVDGICLVKEGNNYRAYTSYYLFFNNSTEVFSGNAIMKLEDGNYSGPSYGTYYIGNLTCTGVVFNSVADAKNYVKYGDVNGIIDGTEEHLPSPPINWGGNSPDGSSSSFNPDTENIPAPTFEIDTSNGNNHSIKFTNQIYNYSNHGVYGLVLKCSWLSFDDFNLSKTGNVMWNTDWKVYYNTTLETSPIVTVYDIPSNESQIVRCPATINFNTQTESVSAFNQFLSLYPTSERTVNYTVAGDQGELLIEFQDYLGEISCPYNTCVFSCYYYREMADGTFHYGPISTSHFDVPQQGAVYRRGQSVLDPNPGVTPDDPYYNPGVQPGGTVTPGGIPSGEQVDPSTLYNNMKGLFAFIGELPQLIAGLFQFLPEWVIAFIAVSIGLLVAIGVVKLFVG